MKRGLLSLAILSLADPALASGVRAGNVAPVMIAPVFIAGALALVVGVSASKDHHGSPVAWLAAGAVLLTIIPSRIVAGFGFIAAVSPQLVVIAGLLMLWRRRAERPGV
jgi:hypothetical protein